MICLATLVRRTVNFDQSLVHRQIMPSLDQRGPEFVLPHLPPEAAIVWCCVVVMPIVPIRQSVSVTQTLFGLHIGGAFLAHPIAQHYAHGSRALSSVRVSRNHGAEPLCGGCQ